MSRRMLIAGNWKMNGLRASLDFFDEVAPLATARRDVDILICPPATLITAASERSGSVALGAQDCHVQSAGAHTGDISANMLKDAGARYVILGHSERRADHHETSPQVREKAVTAVSAGLTPIICVGETRADREAGRAQAIVVEQVAQSVPGEGRIIIAYEPVWAIGTGLTASTADIADMHDCIRSQLAAGETTQILYGGSVKPSNAAEIFALEDVDGGLIGGASLKAADFSAIIEAAPVRTEETG